ncbi:glycosyltransferase [Chelatococcus asaccharovorans]|uniref:Glycosyltransferase involved in cell wall biosynthesis n=1 Tax=Chelatococcus asaccharovorans TaxID=28210 RepID=A0A2V3U327_9HYPH|nr:glycosyltransferase [Chelatococcus asaccharovorans]PXW57145.1 glycosyltransferase involved in cell wall biosynthesis [Chelatococcus asaccharovorans]
MRILHVFRTPVGGLFRHVMDLARGQSERGHDVGIICDATTGGARADAALASLEASLSLSVRRVAMGRLPGVGDLATIRTVARHVRHLRPDVVHGHGAKGGLFARLAASRKPGGPARVYTPHGGSFHYGPAHPAHHLYMAVERYLARRTDLFIFESGFVREEFHRYLGPSGQLEKVVHNGLTEAEFAPLSRPSPAFDLLFIGELRTLKGIDILLDAIALLRASGQPVPRLLIVGAGPDEAAFRAQIVKLGLSDTVTMRPPSPIRHVLPEARAMVVPSRAESLPYVILEAAAAGQPLIATRVGGIPEIFGPAASRLVAPADVPALAAAITQTLGDANRALADAEALRDYVHASFSVSLMVDGILLGYDEIRAR